MLTTYKDYIKHNPTATKADFKSFFDTANIPNYLDKISELLTEWNNAYRNGESLVPDPAFDALHDIYKEHRPEDLTVNANWENKEVPIELSGLTAVHSISEYKKWLKNKGIPDDTVMVATPKYDGVSILNNEGNEDAWGGGDTTPYISDRFPELNGSVSPTVLDVYSVGEGIMSRTTWEKYSDEYKNARNFVSTTITRPTPSKEILNNIDYIRYTIIPLSGIELNKIEQLNVANIANAVKVPHFEFKACELTQDLVDELFNEWNIEYELDGVVIDVNDSNLRESLGRESTTNNPKYAVKFKGDFEELKSTKVLSIDGEISKFGVFSPVIHIDPIELDGVTVKQATGNNAKHVRDFGISVGSEILIKRSGAVIPKVMGIEGHKIPQPYHYETTKEYDLAINALKDIRSGKPYTLPTHCPNCNTELKWDSVNLVCTNDKCDGIQLKKLEAFFVILGVEEFKLATIKSFYDGGYKTVNSILRMSIDDMMSLDRIGESSANTIYKNIHSKCDEVELSKFQHASSVFKGLGEKKLLLINEVAEKTYENLCETNGISDKLAIVYLNSIDVFIEFKSDLPITLKKVIKLKPSTMKLENQTFVFTGFRNKDWEQIIIGNGGKLGSSVSKKTTHLVMKEKNSGSSKEKKAITLGVTIMDVVEFEQFLTSI
jgi:NAD-dependent DNA ligase